MSQNRNKMAVMPVGKLIWKMGLPMIVSMILQAVYNIVDTAFVINMEGGVLGNLALTYAFPIQLLIIAIGVGTGVGINTLLSQSLGEGSKAKAGKIVGNGIFLGICIYIAFLLFGIFGARAFITMQAGDNDLVIEMGTRYLTICCCLSFGAIGFTVYERFLQSAGRTMYSTISQISGAVTNIVLDYVFIYPLGWGVAGAAWATVIGQIVSLVVAMIFHYTADKEVDNDIKYIKPDGKTIKKIYHIGISAALMQALLSVMMLGVNLILGSAVSAELLQGSFGIYYKIMQFALFSCFGLSNTIISALSFNFGMKDNNRSVSCIKWGIFDTLIVSVAITVLFECLAVPLAELFGMTKPFVKKSVYNLLKNEKYSGVYKHGEEVINNMYPQIVPQDMYESVQKIIESNRYGRRNGESDYLLKHKLVCGYCGEAIHGESGTTKNGTKLYYYKCNGRKKRLNDCQKSVVRKEVLEQLVISNILEQLSKPETTEKVIAYLMEMQKDQIESNQTLQLLLNEKKQVEISVNNIVLAIERGVISLSTNKRLAELETRCAELEQQILIEKAKINFVVSEKEIREYYEQALKLDPRMLINYIVKKIVVFDDNIKIIYNNPTTISPDESQGFSFCTKTVELYSNFYSNQFCGAFEPKKQKIQIEICV